MLAPDMPRLVRLDQLEQFAAINLTSDPGYDPSNRKIPNTAKITLVWLMEDGVQGHNVLHGRYSGGFAGTSAQANAITAALTTGAAWTALATFLPSVTGLVGVVIRDLNVEDAPDIGNTTGGAFGTSVSASLPNEVAAVVTLRTAFVGPANRGRMYLPGFATNALGTGNVIAPAAITAINNWANTIKGALSAQGYVWGIGKYSRVAYTGVSGAQHPARPASLEPITTSATRDNHWDSQRRRGLK